LTGLFGVLGETRRRIGSRVGFLSGGVESPSDGSDDFGFSRLFGGAHDGDPCVGDAPGEDRLGGFREAGLEAVARVDGVVRAAEAPTGSDRLSTGDQLE